MGIGALLTRIPGIGSALLRLTTWLMERKWGQWLMFFFASALWGFVEKLIGFFGVMLVANQIGVGDLVPYVSGPLLGMPEPFPQLLALTKIDVATTIIISALVVRVLSSIKIQRKPGAPGWSTSPGAS